VLTGVLAFVSRTQNPVLGAGLLFVYALGIGVPFFLIGVFTVRMPKGGVWMEWVKSFFGVALLALAAGYLRDAYPFVREQLAHAGELLGRTRGIGVSALLAFAGVALGAIHFSFHDRRQAPVKGLGVFVLVVAFLLRMSSGAAVAPATVTSDRFQWAMIFKADEAKSATPFDDVLARAKADCKPVMIDFFADWCAACKELDAHTYVAKDVVGESQRFVTIKVDGTNDHEVLDGLYARFGVQGLPTVAFIDPMGQLLPEPRVNGFLAPDQFLTEMRKVALATCSRDR
jgi:thiol:disulfide interchange protein DsbD